MNKNNRQNRIYNLLTKYETMTVEDLSEILKVSAATIRRDLTSLEEKKLVLRTYGKAHFVENRARHSTRDLSTSEKQKISEEALHFIKDGASIIIDAGTTTFELAKALLKKQRTFQNVNIVTNELSTANILSGTFRVTMPGGLIFSEESIKYQVGNTTCRFFDEINADILFLGSTGIKNTSGLTVSNPLLVEVKKKMVEAANLVIALVDSQKFLNNGLFQVIDYSFVDILITIQSPENLEQLERLKKFEHLQVLTI